jgi:iron complex transport system ATP-binding protein
MLKFHQCTVQQKRTLFSIPDLSLEKGQFVALIGANGTGKSTFLSSLSGSHSIQGNLTIGGLDWWKMLPRDRAKTVALVDNRFQGLEHLSTQEYLELGRFPYTNFIGRLSEKDKSKIQMIAEEMKLTGLLSQATSSLSDGERQRASIARALIQETPIILLDEPTSFLDFPTKRFIMSQVKQIVEEHGKLVIMATHDLELSIQFCSHWMVIHPTTKKLEMLDGNVTVDELIQKAFPEIS